MKVSDNNNTSDNSNQKVSLWDGAKTMYSAVKQKADAAKPTLDSIVDPVAVAAASNAGMIYGALSVADQVDDPSLSKLALVGAGAGILAANKYLVLPIANKFWKRARKRRKRQKELNEQGGVYTESLLSYVKSAVIAAGVGACLLGGGLWDKAVGYIEDVRGDDIVKVEKESQESETKILEDFEMKYDMAYPMDEDSRITSDYGEQRGNRAHKAIDLSSPDVGECLGEPIYAALDGIVEKAGRCRNGYGNFNNGNWITLDHGDGKKTKYLHLKKGSLEVPLDCSPKQKVKVKKGQKIAECGGSGVKEGSYAPHLHFVLTEDGRATDPIVGNKGRGFFAGLLGGIFGDNQKQDHRKVDYREIDYKDAKLQTKIKAGAFEDGFLNKVEDLCEELDMDAMGLLSIMDFETNGTFSPSIKNPNGTATGLIQITEDTAKDLGTTTAQLKNMRQLEQLDWVAKYFRKFKTSRTDYSNPQDIALMIFYRPAVGKGDDFVIAREGRKAYSQNSKLDRFPPDGRITSFEYSKRALDRGYNLDRS